MIFFLFLHQFAFSEQKQLNLTRLIKGIWNSTVHYMSGDGDFLSETNFLEITFEKQKYNILKGTLKGIDDEFDVYVKLDPDNQQKFTIEFERHDSLNIDGMQHITTSVMNYYKRNMPVARGQWENATKHFQILVFSPIHFELSIYRMDLKIVEIYRFTKTQVPEFEDIIKAISIPVIFGLIFIGLNLFKVHQYIKEEEEKQSNMKSHPNNKNELKDTDIKSKNDNIKDDDNKTEKKGPEDKIKKD
ncbi:hypothetical protein M9Y10_001088 [Tritrichomonas musculus]|uniref:Uncharacterized protein n=1 Tax=Tritrichomonas musculus TaxID=1915356 RepID=A0ABR2L626_9EUKA